MSNKNNSNKPHTLSIDIGGTGIKMMILDADAKPLTEYTTEPTPKPATVEALCAVFKNMITSFDQPFDRVSAGFPGVIEHGVVKTAVNLHTSWLDVSLQKKLEEISSKPVRVANDADIQGLGDIKGKGLEMVITLGTGVGSALFIDGHLVPNLELGHHPFMDNYSYEELLSKAYIEANGEDKWRMNLKRAIQMWAMIFNYDTLYIGGGFAHIIKFELPENVKTSENIEGVLGGIKLWEN
jgi:polyphosphate glucokinase